MVANPLRAYIRRIVQEELIAERQRTADVIADAISKNNRAARKYIGDAIEDAALEQSRGTRWGAEPGLTYEELYELAGGTTNVVTNRR